MNAFAKARAVFLIFVVVGAVAFSPTAQGDEKKPKKDEEKAKKVDPSGTWKWERKLNENTATYVLRLRMDGDKITGTYKGRLDEIRIADAKMDGDVLSFRFERARGDFRFTAKYQGKVSEDAIKGSFEISSNRGERKADWQAKRSTELADVVGMWHMKIETPDGTVLEPSIRFSKDGDKVKGAYVGPRGNEREATNIKVKDNKLSFEISGENDGNSFKVVYTGKPRGDSIKGAVDYDFDGNTGTIDFEGKRLAEKKNPKKKEAG